MLTNNAIAYAHFQLRGGWKNTLVTAGVYALVIVSAMTLATKVDPLGIGWIRGWVGGILALQTLVLLLFATSRISLAVRNDINQKLIESHRLMPLPASAAIVGYLLGGSSQALALAAANYVIGAVAAATIGIGQDQWFAANFILLTFSIFFWTFATVGAFTMTRGKGGIGWVIGLSFTIFSSQGIIALLLPGLTLLASPIVGRTIYTLQASTAGGFPVAFAFSLPGQIAIGALCFFAAARRYRQPEQPAFSPLMGLTLLAAWVAMSITAMQFWEEVCPDIGMFRLSSRDEPGIRMAQMILSTFSAMLLAMLPIANSSHADVRRRMRRAYGEHRHENLPLSPVLMTIVCAILCLSIPTVLGIANTRYLKETILDTKRIPFHTWASALTGATILSQLFAMSFILRMVHRSGGKRGVWVALAYVLLFWLLPLGIDLVRAINVGRDNDVIATISTFSPVGVMIDLWAEGRYDPTYGVIGQVVVAVILGLLYYTTGARRDARAVAAPVAPA